MSVLDWRFDADPSMRRQTLRGLLDAPAEVLEAGRARVAEGGPGRPTPRAAVPPWYEQRWKTID